MAYHKVYLNAKKMMYTRARFFCLLLLLGVPTVWAHAVHAAGTPAITPYFVSIDEIKARGRRGPSKAQPILWVYTRKGLPLLVLDESDKWLQVRDPQGDVTWMAKRLVSRRRTLIVTAKAPIAIYRKAGKNENIVAFADPGALLRLRTCESARCQVKSGTVRGWIDKDGVWGLEPVRVSGADADHKINAFDGNTSG